MRTHDDLTVAAGLSVDPARWREQFDELTGRIAGVEPRRRARAFVLGLLSGLRRKNCWTIAEQAGDATPDGMHHLLAGSPSTMNVTKSGWTTRSSADHQNPVTTSHLASRESGPTRTDQVRSSSGGREP